MKQTGNSSPRSAYELIARAMAELTPMTCVYDGYAREFCPIILGRSDGREKALVYQFRGETSHGPIKGPEWKCFFVSHMHALRMADGPWQAGGLHRRAQTCVKIVDLDVNPSSPYNPRRRLDANSPAARKSQRKG